MRTEAILLLALASVLALMVVFADELFDVLDALGHWSGLLY